MGWGGAVVSMCWREGHSLEHGEGHLSRDKCHVRKVRVGAVITVVEADGAAPLAATRLQSLVCLLRRPEHVVE